MKSNFYSSKNYTLLFTAMLFFGSLRAQTLHFFASPNVSSTGDGSSMAAQVNLARVSVLLKEHLTQPCTVYLTNGAYPAFSLDATDSRIAAAPVVYTSMTAHGVVFQ